MPSDLNKLLVRARSAELTLKAKGDSVLVTPKSKMSPEMRDDLRRVKAELSAYLRWDEEKAFALWKDALSCLAPAYLEAGSPDFDLEVLREPWDRVDDAFARGDMFALRIAVRDWLQAGLRAFETHNAKNKGTV